MADPALSDPTLANSDPAAGDNPAPFYEGFADDALKTSPAIQRYKTPEELAGAYVNLEKRFGIDPARRIDLPADPNDAEGMRAVYAKLGLPEKADGYGLKMPDGATDSDKATLAGFADTAHKLGLPPSMAKGLFDWWAQQGADQVTAQEAAVTERVRTGNEALKTEFGQAYEQKTRELDGFVEKYFPKEIAEALKGDGKGMYPNLVRGLAKILDAVAEPGKLDGGTGALAGKFGDPVLTPAQAKAAVRTLEGDPVKGKALTDRNHPQHSEVVKERSRLLAMAEG